MNKKLTISAIGAAAALVSTATAGTMAVAEPVAPMPAPVAAVDDELGFTLSVGYDTDYVFRGQHFGENLVWSGLDFSHAFSDTFSLDLGAWYAGLADDDFTELDLYGSVTASVGVVDLSVGYIHYIFFRDDTDVPEVFGAVATEFAGVGLELFYAYDFEIEGSYLALTAGYGWQFNEMFGVDFSAGVSYSFDYYTPSSDWNNVDIRLGFPITITDRATLEPYAAVSIALDAVNDAGDSDRFYGGVALSVTF